MSNSTNFQPNWVSCPGETISDVLNERKLSIQEFAYALNYSVEEIDKLLKGFNPINIELASKLESVVGGSSDFWLEREYQYRENLARITSEKEKAWLKRLPIRDMVKLGWISKSENLLETCFDFFGVKNLFEWENRYYELSKQVAYRKSNTFSLKLESVSAWLNQAEKIALNANVAAWDKHKFETSLGEIRALTRLKSPQIFLPQLQKKCATSGVALVVIKTPSGCPISGATKLLPSKKPLLLLSFRYLTDDQFWFTFFHEAGHLVLHSETLNIESKDPRESTEDKETEASQFAEDLLIPEEYYHEMVNMKLDKFTIVRFAHKVGISPGIVVGQLQHMGLTKFNYFNQLKRRYKWEKIKQ